MAQTQHMVKVTKQFKKVADGSLKAAWEDPTEAIEQLDAIAYPPGTLVSNVGVTLGLTLNLGSYEFARIEVTCSTSVVGAEVEDGYAWASNFAKERLKGEVEAIRKLAKEK